MAFLPEDLATALRAELSLQRAVETGTHIGTGAGRLADIFPSVFTIEVSERLHTEATRRLRHRENIRLFLGDSVDLLPQIVDEKVPSFYWLDGHWTPTDSTSSSEGGGTGIGALECPVVDEIRLLSRGHPDDCIVVDDARIFAIAPSPPFDASQWPSTLDVIDALRAARPDHHVTLAADFLIAVPERARRALDDVARGWMTHQGWQISDVPLELTEEGWVMDRRYEARLEELVEQRLADERRARTLSGRIGRAVGRR